MKKILVLQGGWNNEREVSLKSGQAVTQSLCNQGYQVSAFDVTRDIETLIQKVKTVQPDIVANFLHGPFGEDGGVQSILEALHVSYTSSNPLASALAMYKPKAKVLFRAHGVPCAPDVVTTVSILQTKRPFDFPFVIKPLNEGSSFGVYIIHSQKDLTGNVLKDPLLKAEVMVEPYIPGRELSVPVINGEAMGIIELQPKKGFFYDYTAKYTPGHITHLCPAPLEIDVEDRLKELSVVAVKSLGCVGVCRIDWRLEGTSPFILEVNTQPGMVEFSLVPEVLLKVKGWTFDDLVRTIIESAIP